MWEAHSDQVTHTKVGSAQRQLWEEGQGGGISHVAPVSRTCSSRLFMPSAGITEGASTVSAAFRVFRTLHRALEDGSVGEANAL